MQKPWLHMHQRPITFIFLCWGLVMLSAVWLKWFSASDRRDVLLVCQACVCQALLLCWVDAQFQTICYRPTVKLHSIKILLSGNDIYSAQMVNKFLKRNNIMHFFSSLSKKGNCTIGKEWFVLVYFLFLTKCTTIPLTAE